MPCLHGDSLAAESDYQSNVDIPFISIGGVKQRTGTNCVVEDTFVTSAGWIFSPLWSRRAQTRCFGFRKAVGSKTVDALLDYQSDSARNYFSRRASREMVNGSSADKCCHGSNGGTRAKKDARSLTPQQCRRRESHPQSGPSRRFSGPFLDRPSSTVPALEEGDYLTLEKCSHARRSSLSPLPPRSPTCLKSPTSPRAMRSPWSPRLPRSPRRVGPCGRRASCDWMVEVMGGAPCRQSLAEVCQRVLQHVGHAIAAEQCSFALVTDNRAGGKCLSGVVFHMHEDDSRGQGQPNWDKCIMEYVVETGKSINIMDVNEDTRFCEELDCVPVSRPKSILGLPVHNTREELVGVAMVTNKTVSASNYGQYFFSEEDEKILSTHVAMLGVILDNAQLAENAEQESRRSQVLLDFALLLSEKHDSQESLLNKMASTILPITRAQLCSVFFTDSTDENSFSYIIDTENMSPGEYNTSCKRQCDVNRISHAYALHVKNSLETLNVANISKDNNALLDQATDTSDEMRTLVCTPVRNGPEGNVLGVCQLVNKQSEGASRAEVFGRADERLLEDFALYCGLALKNLDVQQKAEQTRAKQEVTREVLSYHISATEEEIMALQESSIPTAESLFLMDYSFSDFGLPDTVTTRATVRMFMDLNLLQEFNIDYKSLCRWVLSVRRCYRRDVAYHNWHHALTTAQCMFAMLKATGYLQSNFTNLEILALMIATLCHDLDHRGVNNSYIERSQQPLAQLYGHSSLEHHHYDLCVLILNNPGSEILSGLSQEDYQQCLQMIEKNILATDLALYMQRREQFFKIARRQNLCLEDQDHRELLRSMLMTASDISAITKPWPVQKKTASLIASEFFAQGDREKDEFNVRPIGVMNRENSTRLPHMQVEYINGICAPLYKALARMFEPCTPLLQGCMDNRDNWQRLAEGDGNDESEAEDG